MIRGGLLVGAVALGAGIGGSAPAAPIAAARLGPAGFGLAYSDGSVAAPTAFAGWMPAAALAARSPGIDPGGFLGGPADGGLDDGAGSTAAAAASASGGAAEVLLAALLRLPVPDTAAMLPPVVDLRLLPGRPGDAAATLVVPPSQAAGESPPPGAGEDLLVEYAVPALAAASLPAAGLLAFGLVRRRRRAALARRIKLASARNALRPARPRRR